MTIVRRRVGLLALVVTAAVLTACGSNAGPATVTASSAATSSAPSSSSPLTTSAPANTPVFPSSGASSSRPRTTSITLTGKVKDGVEAGCLVLEAASPASGSYTLVGHGGALRSGQTVTVQGRPTDGMSICQQGTLFEIDKVLKVSPS